MTKPSIMMQGDGLFFKKATVVGESRNGTATVIARRSSPFFETKYTVHVSDSSERIDGLFNPVLAELHHRGDSEGINLLKDAARSLKDPQIEGLGLLFSDREMMILSALRQGGLSFGRIAGACRCDGGRVHRSLVRLGSIGLVLGENTGNRQIRNATYSLTDKGMEALALLGYSDHFNALEKRAAAGKRE